MSFITGVPAECLFSNTADGTQLATFTTEASLIQGMNGMQPVLPAMFFYNLQQGTGKTISIRATGILSSTATPTFTFFVRIGSTINVVTGTSLGQTAAITTGSGVTNQFWELEMDLILDTMGMGAGTATLQGAGMVTSPGFASPFIYPVTPAASATAWTVTIDPTTSLYLMLSASCSASNAANKIQLKQLRIVGWN